MKGIRFAIALATLIFFAINRMMIRPIRRLTDSMQAYSDDPEDPSRVLMPDEGRDELAVAGRHLASMQSQLQKTLKQQKNLAALGLAVSKINHDMRNILASAQLMSDRLATVRDPSVQSFAPKLVRTLDRAIAYTEGVLAYGRTQEAAPARRRLKLRLLVDEVHGLLGIDPAGGIEFEKLFMVQIFGAHRRALSGPSRIEHEPISNRSKKTGGRPSGGYTSHGLAHLDRRL